MVEDRATVGRTPSGAARMAAPLLSLRTSISAMNCSPLSTGDRTSKSRWEYPRRGSRLKTPTNVVARTTGTQGRPATDVSATVKLIWVSSV